MTRAELFEKARKSQYRLKASKISEDHYEDVVETRELKKHIGDVDLGTTEDGWEGEIEITGSCN